MKKKSNSIQKDFILSKYIIILWTSHILQYSTRYLIQSDNTVNYSFKAADIQKAFVKKNIERATADFTLWTNVILYSM